MAGRIETLCIIDRDHVLINGRRFISSELPTQSNVSNTLKALANTCPLCGGTLSEIRTDGKKKWRHCYSCHMEQEVQDSA